VKRQKLALSIGRDSGCCVATGDQLRVVHGKVAVETGVEGISATAESDGVGRTAGRGNDAANLPTAGNIRRKATLRSRNIPDYGADNSVADVEVACANSVRFA